MIKISKQNNSLIVEGIDNVFYPNNGDNSYPLNSLIVVTDNSDMATFRSVATNDVLFSGLINNITINGEVVTKDNIIAKFDAVSNSSTGGGGGTVDAYTKEEADNKFASKAELTNVQTVANDADTKVDALTPRVESVETAMNGKQDLLVSGTNIKTINNQSILGEGNIEISVDVDLTNYYTKPEADNKFATKDELTAVETVANNADTKADAATSRVQSVETSLGNKQDTLVSGTNIKTINGVSVLGEGNIEISDYYTKTEADEIFATTTQVNHQAADISALQTDMRGKQATLVSGENIKTINSQSILGSGDLTISGVSDEQAQEIAKIPTLETELALKVDVSDVPTVQTDIVGTNKNYIYSSGNMISSDNCVVSNIKNSTADADTLNVDIYNWGGTLGKLLKLPSATTTAAGVMSAADKTKLDSIPENIPSQSEIDGIAANVSALQTAMDGKQATLVSGTNIKTINGNSILGEGNLVIEGGGIDLSNYYTKTETDTKLDAKQNTLVSGTNIKTINSESILGEGNITTGPKTYIVKEINENFDNKLREAINALKNGVDFSKQVPYSNSITQLLKRLVINDYLKVDTWAYTGLLEYSGQVNNCYRFRVNIYGEQLDSNNFTTNIVITTNDSYQSIYIYTNNGGFCAKIQDIPSVVTEKGESTTAVMSQKAVTDELNTLSTAIENIPSTDLSNYYNKTEVDTKLDAKQNTLVSGTNIKTINSQSILGEGNIEVTIPDATTATSGAMSAADKTKLDSMSNEWTGTQQEYDALTTKDNNTIYYVTE